MNGRVYSASLTVPAGTPVSAPVSTLLPVPVGRLVKITLMVPRGHNGQTGVQITLSGTPIVPYSGAAFIVADDYTDSWQVDQDVNPGQVAIVGYNTGIYPHTFYVRGLHVSPPPPPAAGAAGAGGAGAVPDLSQLQQYPAAASAGGVAGYQVAGGGGGACYDADGNVVDCSDPSAVSGPVTAAAGGGGGNGGAAAGGGGGLPELCYDQYGSVVDCSDPAAVSIGTPPPVPGGGPPPPPGYGQPPPPPGYQPPPLPPPPEPGKPPPPRRPHDIGPFRHIADGTRSLDQIARIDRTTAHAIIDLTRADAGLTRAELIAFNHYVRGGTERKMHRGLAYYTLRRQQ